MNWRSNHVRWGTAAKTFHWLLALAIIGNGTFGLLMVPPTLAKINIFALHKSIGLTILALVLLRLAWRLFDGRPADVPAPTWQRLAAHAVHAVLYLIILAIPVSGWWFNSARGFPLQWFKLFNLPPLTGKSDAVAHLAVTVHESLFWLLLLLLVAHAGAALKHHAFDNDNTLRRMLPFGRLRHTPDVEGDKP